jgi:hypothetical protein
MNNAMTPGEIFLLQYGNGTQVARVRAVTSTGYRIERMVGATIQGYTNGTPTHALRGFEWREVKAPIKATDSRILGGVPATDERRRHPAFRAVSGFHADP